MTDEAFDRDVLGALAPLFHSTIRTVTFQELKKTHGKFALSASGRLRCRGATVYLQALDAFSVKESPFASRRVASRRPR